MHFSPTVQLISNFILIQSNEMFPVAMQDRLNGNLQRRSQSCACDTTWKKKRDLANIITNLKLMGLDNSEPWMPNILVAEDEGRSNTRKKVLGTVEVLAAPRSQLRSMEHILFLNLWKVNSDPAETLILECWLFELWENRFLLSLSHQVYGNLLT